MSCSAVPVSARALAVALAALLTLGVGESAAQSVAPVRRNSVYVEAGGNAVRWSLNAERLITPRLAVRVGYGAWPERGPFRTTRVGSIPVMLNVLRGPDHRQLELGAGVLLHTSFDARVITATLGARFTGPDGPLFRIGLTPSYSLDEHRFVALAGASLGFRF